MRLWSLHPKLLDWNGLQGQWKEAIEAQNILMGKSAFHSPKHPQLIRFWNHPYPIRAITYYLFCVWSESIDRGYGYNEDLILKKEDPYIFNIPLIKVTRKQLEYEWNLLKAKFTTRKNLKLSPFLQDKDLDLIEPFAHSLFEVVDGEIEEWERVKEWGNVKENV